MVRLLELKRDGTLENRLLMVHTIYGFMGQTQLLIQIFVIFAPLEKWYLGFFLVIFSQPEICSLVGSESYPKNRKNIFDNFVLDTYVTKIATHDTLIQLQ